MKTYQRFLNYIRCKLIKFLSIDIIERDFHKYKHDNDTFLRLEFRSITQNAAQLSRELETLHMSLKSILNVGADVIPHESRHEHSWAVVCIEGNINIVKFINLEHRSARDVLDFLKQFEGGRMVVDTPIPQIFYEGFIFNKDFKKSIKET